MPVTPNFKERLKKISARNMKVVHKKNHNWTMEKKIEVVSQYLVLGNMRLVAATTGVAHGVIRNWKALPWWKDLESEIRQTQNIEMDTKLSRIVDKSLDAVLDRVENGEYVFDKKENKLKRVPATLRDIHRVSTDTISKRELIRGNATERKEVSQVSVAEQLKLLADEFSKWAGKQQQIVELDADDVTDITPKDEDEGQGNETSEVDSFSDVSSEDSDSDEQGRLDSLDESEQDYRV